jgi:hypothetical protein
MSAPAISESPRPGSLARPWWLPVFFAVVFILFYLANRAAFYHELVTPKLSQVASRTVGGLYHRFLCRAFNLTYWPYVAFHATLIKAYWELQYTANITVLEDGHSFGTQSVAEPRVQSLRWTLTPSAAGNKSITIRTERPGARETSGLGIAVDGVGYVTS